MASSKFLMPQKRAHTHAHVGSTNWTSGLEGEGGRRRRRKKRKERKEREERKIGKAHVARDGEELQGK